MYQFHITPETSVSSVIQEFGAACVPDESLIDVLLGLTEAKHNWLVSHGLEGLSPDLLKSRGFTSRELTKTLAIAELLTRRPDDFPVIKGPSALMPFIQAYGWYPEENVGVCLFNGAGRLIKTEHISKGTQTRAVVSPREILKCALDNRATSIILFHNHPSGQVNPSEEDNRLTTRLRDACRLMGISLLDHIIVARNNYFSYTEEGMPEVRSEGGF